MGKIAWEGMEMTDKIIANKIQCKKCQDIIESRYTHDFVWCKCGSVAVDGGKSYLRRCGEPDDMIDMSEYRDE